jgi:hypothetical protein
MTVPQIQKRQDREVTLLTRKYEVAKQIRQLLDALRKEVGEQFYDNDWTTAIIELVTEEG